jgi:hypothetical protein
MTTSYDDIPAPAGAVRVYQWEDPGTPGARRYFAGSRWVIEQENRDRDINGVRLRVAAPGRAL